MGLYFANSLIHFSLVFFLSASPQKPFIFYPFFTGHVSFQCFLLIDSLYLILPRDLFSPVFSEKFLLLGMAKIHSSYRSLKEYCKDMK